MGRGDLQQSYLPFCQVLMNSYRAKTGENISLGDLLVVSLGTGRKARGLDIKELADWGQIKWIEPLIDITLNGQSEVVDYQMEQLLSTKLHQNISKQNYYRFQPQYSEIKNSKQYSMGEDDLIYVNDNMDDANPAYPTVKKHASKKAKTEESLNKADPTAA